MIRTTRRHPVWFFRYHINVLSGDSPGVSMPFRSQSLTPVNRWGDEVRLRRRPDEIVDLYKPIALLEIPDHISVERTYTSPDA